MMVPAMYWLASAGEIHAEKTWRKKNQEITAMENGLTIQLTKRVISTPFGFLPTARIAVKSTFIIMGMIISQIKTAMGRLIWLPVPNSRLLQDADERGEKLAQQNTNHHAERTQTLR